MFLTVNGECIPTSAIQYVLHAFYNKNMCCTKEVRDMCRRDVLTF